MGAYVSRVTVNADVEKMAETIVRGLGGKEIMGAIHHSLEHLNSETSQITTDVHHVAMALDRSLLSVNADVHHAVAAIDRSLLALTTETHYAAVAIDHFVSKLNTDVHLVATAIDRSLFALAAGMHYVAISATVLMGALAIYIGMLIFEGLRKYRQTARGLDVEPKFTVVLPSLSEMRRAHNLAFLVANRQSSSVLVFPQVEDSKDGALAQVCVELRNGPKSFEIFTSLAFRGAGRRGVEKVTRVDDFGKMVPSSGGVMTFTPWLV
ncbi:hypothetical protein B0H16DRAFT_1449699 [Mycena metata]|uniref:Uncharacterized protein n=1 Tax=Mycena metata TaxID=1033252 RepID=A0AAD7K5N0_9AGAR|nr:hypothetical protein B0H16DRAFT_1449699 [Mycena metata]